MANVKSSSNVRNLMYSGKHALLPPKIPFPGACASNTEYVPSSQIGSKAIQKPRDGKAHHQRTSSETFLFEEQPSWLDDLLNEPETPIRRGHRRSSSDSFAYIDAASASNIDYAAQDDYRVKNAMALPSWGSQDFDYLGDARKSSPCAEANLTKWESLNAPSHCIGLSAVRENAVIHSSGSSCAVSVSNGFLSSTSKKQDTVGAGPQDSQTSSERKDGDAKFSTSEVDTKRAKQQFAQRSRVRKLQYIAELERNVQTLQAEGSGVSAELEFLNQQNLILSLENKALKQRLESLAKEQLIKHFEQGVLEKEIARLRNLYQQQQQLEQQQQHQKQQKQSSRSSHRRNSSKDLDLDSQFANLTLKLEGSCSHDPVTGALQI